MQSLATIKTEVSHLLLMEKFTAICGTLQVQLVKHLLLLTACHKQIVLSGLEGNEKIIVNGLQKAKDGAVVRASLVANDVEEAK